MMEEQAWKILLVEDDEDDYLLTRSLLREMEGREFELDWARTYAAGLEACRTLRHNVYLVDYRLGERDGLELVREAVAAGCQAPIILMTGQGSYEVDLEAQQAGVTDYLVKSEVNAHLLERAIRYAIDRKRAEEALQQARDELEQRVQQRTAELKASESRFRNLAETTSAAIFIVQDDQIRYANPAARIVTGHPPETLVGTSFWELAHPSYREVLKQRGLAAQWVEGAPVRYELKLITPSGEERWVDLTAGTSEFEGSPALIVTAFDITSRDLAEQELRRAKSALEARVSGRTEELHRANIRQAQINAQLAEANEKLGEANEQLAAVNRSLRAEMTLRQRMAGERERLMVESARQRRFMDRLMQSAPIGIAVLRGPEHRYEYANASYAAMVLPVLVGGGIPGATVYSPPIPDQDSPVVGRIVAEILPDPAASGMVELLDQVYRTGQAISLREVELAAGPGHERTFWNADYLPLKDADGGVEGILVVVSEITGQVINRRRLEEMALQRKAILDSLVEGLVIVDARGNILSMNPAGLRIYGFTRLEEARRHFEDLQGLFQLQTLDGKPLAPEARPVARILRGESFSGLQIKVTQPDAGRSWIASYSGTPVWDAAGEISLGILTVRDITARIEVEAERERLLRENQRQKALLGTIIESAPVGLAVVGGPELTFQLANAAYRVLTPHSERTLLGQPYEAVWEEAARPAAAVCREVMATGNPYLADRQEIPDLDGRRRLFTIYARQLPWSGPPGVLILLWETTALEEARQQADAAANEAHGRAEELDAVFNSMADAVTVFDAQGRCVKVNAAAFAMYGFDPQNLSAAEIAHRISIRNPDGQKLDPEALPSSRALRSEWVKQERLLLTAADGQDHEVDASASPLYSGAHMNGAVIVWQDVTERERLLAQVQAERARLAAIMDNAPEGILMADTQGRMLWANPAAERIYAHPIPYGQEVASQAHLQLFTPDGEPLDPRRLPIVLSALDGEVHTNVELSIVRPDGQRRDLLVNTAPIRDATGEIQGAVEILQDITEVQRTREEAMRNAAHIQVQHHLMAQREQERMRIAQDLHDGPLQDLIGITFSLSDAASDVEDEYLQVKLKVLQTLLQQQIGELRNFSTELRPPALNHFGLEKTLRAHAEGFAEKHPELEVRLELDPDHQGLSPDERLALYRIYQELMNNVSRHALARRVEVRLALDSAGVELEVRDDGRGFEPTDDWVELARQGHLGLLGAQERAEALGGSLQIRAAPGAGTAVVVRVPRS